MSNMAAVSSFDYIDRYITDKRKMSGPKTDTTHMCACVCNYMGKIKFMKMSN